MMFIRHAAIAVLAMVIAAAPVATVAQPVAKKSIPKTVVTGDSAAKAIVDGCGDRRFETSAEVDDGAGHKRVSKIKLCAKPGEDDAAWLQTLKKARAQIDGLTQLPPESRAKLATDFDTEIARLSSPAEPTAPALPAPTADTIQPK